MRKHLVVASPLIEMEDDEMVVLKILALLIPMALLENDLLHEAH